MTLTAFLHGYPPYWSMGGEVATHRTLRAVPGSTVVSFVPEEYDFEGVHVLTLPDATYATILAKVEELEPSVLFAHSTLSAATVRAARRLLLPSILSVHAPPQYAADLRHAWTRATVRLYNTEAARTEWRDPRGWVLHPPMGEPCEIGKGPRDAFTVTSSLLNKGATQTLRLAKEWPDRRFIIVESPAHPTHGAPDFWDVAATLPNVEVWPRLHPNEMGRLWAETKILLVPSRYETYGMAAVEAAQHGIPCAHVDTIHVREGIGEAARLLRRPTYEELALAVQEIEADFAAWTDKAFIRAEYLAKRERDELGQLPAQVATLTGAQTVTMPL